MAKFDSDNDCLDLYIQRYTTDPMNAAYGDASTIRLRAQARKLLTENPVVRLSWPIHIALDQLADKQFGPVA